MKTKGYFHFIITSFVLIYVSALSLKGFIVPEQMALLLTDTGLFSSTYAKPISFALPLALCLSAIMAYTKLTSFLPVVICFSLYIALKGLALYQGLHFECACYLPGSIQSEVYSKLEPQFLILALVTLTSGALYYYNGHYPALSPDDN
ncbi:hypothetical protein L4D09_00380 [Photobacterium makurazakiensis]|uniref:MauE/DoxX family redox-associated membrane protein n=1 Tax=Photobacterium makurazakiensis TaxID=2910234 RepID=UPI003D0B5D2C